jgi:hypothetical protein
MWFRVLVWQGALFKPLSLVAVVLLLESNYVLGMILYSLGILSLVLTLFGLIRFYFMVERLILFGNVKLQFAIFKLLVLIRIIQNFAVNRMHMTDPEKSNTKTALTAIGCAIFSLIYLAVFPASELSKTMDLISRNPLNFLRQLITIWDVSTESGDSAPVVEVELNLTTTHPVSVSAVEVVERSLKSLEEPAVKEPSANFPD